MLPAEDNQHAGSKLNFYLQWEKGGCLIPIQFILYTVK